MKKLTKIIYLKADLLLTSAMVIGCESDEAADLTPIRDYDGNPFIPGTSLAGAVKDFALKAGLDDNAVNGLFGYTKKTGSGVESYHSKVVIHDCFPREEIKTVSRDMVSLDEKTKTAKPKTKFDVELIPRGTKFDFRIELITYEGDANRLVDYFLSLVKAMSKEKIRLGAKRHRGWGKFKLDNIICETLDFAKPEDIKRWMSFTWDSIKNDNDDLSQAGELSLIKTVWEIPFKIPGALLIRSYQDFSDDDAVMFKEKGEPMIPGTSFTGCLRKACFDILYYDLKLQDPKPVINYIFGFVDENKKSAQVSKLFIEDIVLTMEKEASYTRNKINRFTGGTEDRALFTNKPVYNSSGTIKIELLAGLEDWAKQLLYYALLDIGSGIVPLGGETSIGRGILSFDPPDYPKPEAGANALHDYLQDKPRREVTP